MKGKRSKLVSRPMVNASMAGEGRRVMGHSGAKRGSNQFSPVGVKVKPSNVGAEENPQREDLNRSCRWMRRFYLARIVECGVNVVLHEGR